MANKNIYVALRPRPLDPSSSSIKNLDLRFETEKNTVWIQESSFSFDHIFESQDSNRSVYNLLVPESLKALLEGFNFTILAYGQTGSGKSYTMGTNYVPNEEFNKNNAGIIPHVLEDLFDALKNKEKEVETTVKASFMELYNDDIIDLLTETFHPEKCQLRDVFGCFKIKNLTEKIISSSNEAMTALKEGSKRRKTASTEMNLASSRSHAIFFIFIEQRNRITSEMKYSKLQLIDLAGSERSAVSCTSGDRLKEGSHINKGLFELSNVIQALYLKKKHVPYRNSKLTQLLRDSFGGNSCTIMIACISLAPSSFAESVNTIKYASIARKVVNAPVINTNKELREIQKLKKQVQELQTALLQAKSTCSCKNQASLSHLIASSPDFSTTEPVLKISPPIAYHMAGVPTEFGQEKTNIFEAEINVSIQEDDQFKEINGTSQEKTQKCLQEIQNVNSSIHSCLSFQKIKESNDHTIAKLNQEIKDINQYLSDLKQCGSDLRKEVESRYEESENVICKTNDAQLAEVELTKENSGFDAFVKNMKKNIKQALYAKKKFTEMKKERKSTEDNSTNKNSEDIKDWILKEIEQAVSEKIAHCKIEAAQQDVFNIQNEIHKHSNKIELHNLQKQLKFEQEKILTLEGLRETESGAKMLSNDLNNKEDLKIALSFAFNLLIATTAKLAQNTEVLQEMLLMQQQEKENMMKQNVKKNLQDIDAQKKEYETLIAQLNRTIQIQKDEIKKLKHALDIEHEERDTAVCMQMSSSSMLGEYLEEIEGEKNCDNSISSDDDGTSKTPKFVQSPIKTRKRHADMAIELSCTRPTKALNVTSDIVCSAVTHNEN